MLCEQHDFYGILSGKTKEINRLKRKKAFLGKFEFVFGGFFNF
jgi:hypothetical protein